MLVTLQKYHSVYILLYIVNAGKTAVYILLCIVMLVNLQKYILLCTVQYNAGKTAEISFSIHFTVYSQCW